MKTKKLFLFFQKIFEGFSAVVTDEEEFGRTDAGT